MASVNEIQIGRWSGILHKLLSMKEGAPSPVLAPEITPGIILENDRPEWRFLGGDNAAIFYQELGGVAGQSQFAQVVNPITSGVIAIVEQIFAGHVVAVATQGTYRIYGFQTAPIALANQLNVSVQDFRYALGAPTLSVTVPLLGTYVSSAALPASWAGVSQVIVAPIMAGNLFTPGLFSPIILPPGTAIGIQNTLANSAFTFAFWVRFRQLEQAETR